MNRKAPIARRAIASLVILALTGGHLARAAAETVDLTGRIFQADGTTALRGATVRVTNQVTGQVFSSPPTDASGRYAFESLPPGTYTFEVETAAGFFSLGRAVELGQAEEASISFTIKPEPDAARSGEGTSRRKKKGALYALIGGGAVLLAVSLDDDDGQASPFTP